MDLNLLPASRSLKLKPGKFILPARTSLHLDASLKPDEARAIAKALPREFREGTHLGHGRGHFPEHAHDQEDQEARDGVAQEARGPGGDDGGAAAHEQPGANDAADNDHRRVEHPKATDVVSIRRRGVGHFTRIPFIPRMYNSA